LYRGKNEAMIHSISFSNDLKYLVCSSTRNTIHVFDIIDENEGYSFLSYFSFSSNNENYITSVIKLELQNKYSICSFDKNNNLIILYSNCYFYIIDIIDKFNYKIIKKVFL
jgi:hypothetical protein